MTRIALGVLGLFVAVSGHTAELLIDDFSDGPAFTVYTYGNFTQTAPGALGGTRGVFFQDFTQMGAYCQHFTGSNGRMFLRDTTGWALFHLMLIYYPGQALAAFEPEAIRYTIENTAGDGQDASFTLTTAIWSTEGQTQANLYCELPDGATQTFDVSMSPFTGDWADVSSINIGLFSNSTKSVQIHDITFLGSNTAGTKDLPTALTLAPCFPNPFNPVTRLGFRLPETNQACLYVTDCSGHRVATLLDERVSAGEHEVEFRGAHLASGVYYYTLETPMGSLTRSMTLLK